MAAINQQQSQFLYAGLFIAAGAVIALAFTNVMSEQTAHAQGPGNPGHPGGGGYGTGGIPAVLQKLDAMEAGLHARLDQIDSQIQSLDAKMHARFDIVHVHLDEIQDTVTPRAFDATVDICFELAGGFDAAAGIGLERQWGLEGFVGIDFFGNGAQLTIPPALFGLIPLPSGLGSQAGAQLGGSAGLGAQFCVAFPVSRLNKLAPEQGDLADAIAMAAESLREDLVAFLSDLGINSGNVETKVMSGRSLMATYPSNDAHVLNMLQDGAGQLVNLIDVMPLNGTLKNQVISFTNTQAVPASVPGLDVCNSGVLADAPSAFLPLIQQVCDDHSDGLALRDNINTILSRANQIRSTVDDMRPEVQCLFCNTFPLFCLFTPGACSD